MRNRMKYVLALFVGLALLSATAMTQEKKAEAAPAVTLRGYIVDQSCAKGMAKKADPMTKAASHSKDCALEEACSATGYGIFSDGKLYTFDQEGSKKAKTLIENGKREKGLAFEVTGTLKGNVLTVASIKETTLSAK